MYKSLTSSDVRAMLKVPEEYQVDGLLTFGSYPKSRIYPFFEEAITTLEIPANYEPIQNGFFGEIKSLVTPQGRLWFDVIYGCAYASELVHIASLLGTKAIIHLGSFGALQSDIRPGEIILPDRAYGNESTTRMYSRTKTEPFFLPDDKLRIEMIESIDTPLQNGSVISVQAMLAETPEDIASWQKEGHIGVEMECASLFSVAGHFGVPAAAALYAADNLANNVLVTSMSYEETQHHRKESRDLLFKIALKTLFNRM